VEPPPELPPPPPAAGVTAADGADALDVLTAFVAVASNVYAVPFVSPVTMQLVAGGVTVQFLVASPTTDTV
jgi:hypothetical protein